MTATLTLDEPDFDLVIDALAMMAVVLPHRREQILELAQRHHLAALFTDESEPVLP